MTETSQPLITEPTDAIIHTPVGPGDKPSVTTLKITNPEPSSRVAYKVKTTNNKAFRINPVHGVLDPGASVTVKLTALPVEDPANPPARHGRYAVLSVLASDQEEGSAKNGSVAWEVAIAASGNKNIGMRKTLKIVWGEPGGGTASNASGVPGEKPVQEGGNGGLEVGPPGGNAGLEAGVPSDNDKQAESGQKNGDDTAGAGTGNDGGLINENMNNNDEQAALPDAAISNDTEARIGQPGVNKDQETGAKETNPDQTAGANPDLILDTDGPSPNGAPGETGEQPIQPPDTGEANLNGEP